MNRRIWLGGVVTAFTVLALGVSANAQAPLQWKGFKDKGKVFYQTMTTKTTQKMKVQEQEVDQVQSQTFYISWEPMGEDKDKNYSVKQKIIGVKMDIQIGGNNISYDSTAKDKNANPLTDFFNALVGSEFTLTVKPDMTVTKIDGRKDFIDKLTNANNALKPLLDSILSEKAMEQMFDQSFGVLPSEKDKIPKLEKGKSKWEKKDVKLDLGPIGSYLTTYEYTSEGAEKNLEKIAVKATLKYQPPVNTKDGGLPFKIKSADLSTDKSKESKGEILFDTDKGRIDSSKMNMFIEGKLDIEVGGMTTTVYLTQSQVSELKTSDTNPVQKK
jgi:uncharacterized protein DUF6263